MDKHYVDMVQLPSQAMACIRPLLYIILMQNKLVSWPGSGAAAVSSAPEAASSAVSSASGAVSSASGAASSAVSSAYGAASSASGAASCGDGPGDDFFALPLGGARVLRCADDWPQAFPGFSLSRLRCTIHLHATGAAPFSSGTLLQQF